MKVRVTVLSNALDLHTPHEPHANMRLMQQHFQVCSRLAEAQSAFVEIIPDTPGGADPSKIWLAARALRTALKKAR